MKKELRQKKILNLISKKNIATQLELIDALAEIGIKTTQATLSRDIKELHLVKKTDITGEVAYRVLNAEEQVEYNSEPVRDIFKESVNGITQVQFINIIQTDPNDGSRVAAVIDDAEIDGVKGTLAGYDTLVIFSADAEAAEALHQKLKSFLE
ncbi:MAG: ArgR family transcriptional regulator [Pediococcus pentosaceus]|jgi:transcriptional regulator of arginine metabolism|nr:ArgR family transcriptional regulator [Pediococcus pentosaceus]